MKTEVFNLWTNTPGMCEETPTITAYVPDNKTTNSAVVILPGGGYSHRAKHEGKGYAEYLSTNGICAFVCDYRVAPHRFPLELLDARRAVRFVRHYADKYEIDKSKIAIMGSSAGGHLSALTCTYYDKIDYEGIDEIDNEDFIPNAQILCYPVIRLNNDKNMPNYNSSLNLLGSNQLSFVQKLTPEYIISDKTPQCFIWHTCADSAVPVSTSIDYAKALIAHNIACELHIFPNGKHGLGLALGDDEVLCHVSQWGKLLLNWINHIGF